MHQMEHAAPAGFTKKMSNHMNQKTYTVRHGCALILVFRRIKRPINKERSADHVFPGNESPEPAVQANVAIIAHAKKTVRRDYQLAVFQMLPHHNGPFRIYIRVTIRGDCGKLVAIW